MSEPDLAARVAALEARLGELARQAQAASEDAAAARHLAAANDRDVAELRNELRDFRQATTASFHAHRQDLADLRERMSAEFADVRQEIRTGFTEMRGTLDQTAASQQQIAELLTTLIARQGDE